MQKFTFQNEVQLMGSLYLIFTFTSHELIHISDVSYSYRWNLNTSLPALGRFLSPSLPPFASPSLPPSLDFDFGAFCTLGSSFSPFAIFCLSFGSSYRKKRKKLTRIFFLYFYPAKQTCILTRNRPVVPVTLTERINVPASIPFFKALRTNPFTLIESTEGYFCLM